MELRPRRGRSATQPPPTPSSTVKASPKTRAPASTRKKTTVPATPVSAASLPPAENTDVDNSYETPLPTATKQSRARTSTRKVATSTRRGKSASSSQEKEETDAVSDIPSIDVNVSESCADRDQAIGKEVSEDNVDVPKTRDKSRKVQSAKKSAVKKNDVIEVNPLKENSADEAKQSENQTGSEENYLSHLKDIENDKNNDGAKPSSLDEVGGSMKKSSKKQSSKKKNKIGLVFLDYETIVSHTGNSEDKDMNDDSKTHEQNDGSKQKLFEDSTDLTLQGNSDKIDSSMKKGSSKKQSSKKKNKIDVVLQDDETIAANTGNPKNTDMDDENKNNEQDDRQKKTVIEEIAQKNSTKKKNKFDASDKKGKVSTACVEETMLGTAETNRKLFEDTESLAFVESLLTNRREENGDHLDNSMNEDGGRESAVKEYEPDMNMQIEDTGDKDSVEPTGMCTDKPLEEVVQDCKSKDEHLNAIEAEIECSESPEAEIEWSVEKSVKKEKCTHTMADITEEASVKDCPAHDRQGDEESESSDDDEEMARLFAKSMKTYMNSISLQSVSEDDKPRSHIMEGNQTLQGSMQASGSGSSRSNNHELRWHPDTGLAIPKTFETSMKNSKISSTVKTDNLWKKESKLQDGLCVPPVDPVKLNKMASKQKVDTAGDKWFDLPAQTITTELKKELQLLKLRRVIDPKRHYKADDNKGLPKYFQVGTVVSGPTEFYSGRLTKKERKASLADELLTDSSINAYRKRKFLEIQEQKQAGGKNFWKKKTFKRTPGWAKM